MSNYLERKHIRFYCWFFLLLFISACESGSQLEHSPSKGETAVSESLVLSESSDTPLPNPIITISTSAPDSTEMMTVVSEATPLPPTIQSEPAVLPPVAPTGSVISPTVPIPAIQEVRIGDAIPLNYNLIFLQNHRLKLWLLQKGTIEILLGPDENRNETTAGQFRQIAFYKGPPPPPPPPPGSVVAFTIIADSQKVMATQTANWSLLDPYTGERELVPILADSLRSGTVSPDGRFFVYMEQEETSSNYDIYLRELLGGQPAYVIGNCFSQRNRPPSYYPFFSYSCMPVWMSNSEQVFWDDYRGVWTGYMNNSSARLLLENEYDAAGEILTKVYELEEWSPDGRYLLLSTQTISGTYPTIFDPQSNQIVATAENIRSWQWPIIQWADDSSLIMAHIEGIPDSQSSKLALGIRDLTFSVLDEIALDLQKPMAIKGVRQMSNGQIALTMVGNNNSEYVKTVTDNNGILILDLATKDARWFSFSALGHEEINWYALESNWLSDASGVMVRYGSNLWFIPEDFSIVYDMNSFSGVPYRWLLPP